MSTTPHPVPSGESERTFPVLIVHGTDAVSPVRRIPWSVAERAYMAYARRYGTHQSLERLGERGGFSAEELDDLAPGWREEVSEIARLRAEVARLTAEVDTLSRVAGLAEARAARYREALEEIAGWTMHSGVHRYQQGEMDPRGYYAVASGLMESEIATARALARRALTEGADHVEP